MLNGVRFLASRADSFDSGPETKSDHSELLRGSFITVKKGQRKLLTQTSEGEQESAPIAGLIKTLYNFSIGY